jgi:O-antigen/teichoic acid export membrane protein
MKFKHKIMAVLPDAVRRRLLHGTSSRKIAGNMGWLLVEKIGHAIVAFGVSLLVARYLGPERYGQMCYVIAFVTMFQIVGTLGIQEILVRELIAGEGQEGQILCTAFLLRCAGVLIASMACVTSVYLAKPGDWATMSLAVIASGIYVGKLLMIIQQWFASQLQAKYIAVSVVISLCVTSALKLIFVYLGGDVVVFIIAMVLEPLVAGVLLLGIYLRKNKRYGHHWRWSGEWARRLLSDCWPRIVSGLSVSVINNLSTVFVGTLLAAEILGEYSVAKRMLFFLMFAPNIITQSLAPSLVNAKEQGGAKEYERHLVRLYRMLFLLGAGLGLALALIGWIGIPFLYGERYPMAGVYLIALSISFPFYCAGQGRVWFIITQRAYQYSMWMGVASAFLNVVATYLGIKFLGVWGAISAQLITVVWFVLFQDLIFKRYRINSLVAWKALSPVWVTRLFRAKRA